MISRALTAAGLVALASLATASLVLISDRARAQVHPDAKTGKKLAEKLCSGCHIVGEKATGPSVSADVPSFKAIANVPGQTSERIAGRIVIPHPVMPKIQLTRLEIGDLAAYIMSLRE